MKSILAPGLLILATLLTGCTWDNNNDSEASGPNAVDDGASVAEAGTALIALVDNDTDAGGGLDPGSIEIVSVPAHGTLVVNPDGTASYTHDGSAALGDSFTYTIRDSAGLASKPATVSVTVIPFPTAASGRQSISCARVRAKKSCCLPRMSSTTCGCCASSSRR